MPSEDFGSGESTWEFQLPKHMSDLRCPECGLGLIGQLCQSGPHHGKVVCRNGCRQPSVKWIPKPDDQKRGRPSRSRNLVKKFSCGFCEFCTRLEEELEPNEMLEAHHIVEHSLGQEPDNSRSNIAIYCTRCHRLCHHERTYGGTKLHEKLVARIAERMLRWKNKD